MALECLRGAPLTRSRIAIVLASWLILVLSPQVGHAAAEVHRLNFEISGIPTSINGGTFNDALENYNRVLRSRGIEPIEESSFGWHFDAQLKYFLRPHLAASVGAGQMLVIREREVLPRLTQDIQLRTEIRTIPIHAGVDYYLAPYVQGDFQARAFLGAGVMSLVSNRALLQQTEINTDSSTTLGDPRTPPNNFTLAAVNDAPGYYLQGGVHMWFPSRLSVMIGVYYMGAKVRNLLERDSLVPFDQVPEVGMPLDLDLSGVGARFTIGIGL